MTKKRNQDLVQSWVDMIEELFRDPLQKDTVVAVASAAFLDIYLEHLITTFLADKSQTNKLTMPDRPLGSFGVRIEAAYCLGLISENEYHDLKIVQRIRNRFAHTLRLSFTDKTIKDRCDALKLPWESPLGYEDQNPKEPRNIFQVATLALGFHLYLRISDAMQDRRTIPSEIETLASYRHLM